MPYIEFKFSENKEFITYQKANTPGECASSTARKLALYPRLISLVKQGAPGAWAKPPVAHRPIQEDVIFRLIVQAVKREMREIFLCPEGPIWHPETCVCILCKRA